MSGAFSTSSGSTGYVCDSGRGASMSDGVSPPTSGSFPPPRVGWDVRDGDAASPPRLRPHAPTQTVTTTTSPPAKAFACPLCSRVFNHRALLRRHHVAHTRKVFGKVVPTFILDEGWTVVNPSSPVTITEPRADKTPCVFTVGHVEGKDGRWACCPLCRTVVRVTKHLSTHARECNGHRVFRGFLQLPDRTHLALTAVVPGSFPQRYACPVDGCTRELNVAELKEHLIRPPAEGGHLWTHLATVACTGTCCGGWRGFVTASHRDATHRGIRARAHYEDVPPAWKALSFPAPNAPPAPAPVPPLPPTSPARTLRVPPLPPSWVSLKRPAVGREDEEGLEKEAAADAEEGVGKRPRSTHRQFPLGSLFHSNSIPVGTDEMEETGKLVYHCPVVTCCFTSLTMKHVRWHLMNPANEMGHGMAPPPDYYWWCECTDGRCGGGRAFFDAAHAASKHRADVMQGGRRPWTIRHVVEKEGATVPAVVDLVRGVGLTLIRYPSAVVGGDSSCVAVTAPEDGDETNTGVNEDVAAFPDGEFTFRPPPLPGRCALLVRVERPGVPCVTERFPAVQNTGRVARRCMWRCVYCLAIFNTSRVLVDHLMQRPDGRYGSGGHGLMVAGPPTCVCGKCK